MKLWEREKKTVVVHLHYNISCRESLRTRIHRALKKIPNEQINERMKEGMERLPHCCPTTNLWVYVDFYRGSPRNELKDLSVRAWTC